MEKICEKKCTRSGQFQTDNKPYHYNDESILIVWHFCDTLKTGLIKIIDTSFNIFGFPSTLRLQRSSGQGGFAPCNLCHSDQDSPMS